MKSKVKKIIAILLTLCFLVSLTASAASASHPILKSTQSNAFGEGNYKAGGNLDHGSNPHDPLYTGPGNGDHVHDDGQVNPI